MESGVTANPGDHAADAESTSAASAPVRKTAIQHVEVRPRDAARIDLRSLLEAGVHFGHQTSRWCPSMAPFIYGARNGIHIINLPRTVQCWTKARQAITDVVAEGGTVLFVGTKKQAQEAVVEEATRCGAFYVSQRWLGGMVTNFQTIRRSIDRMRKLEETLQQEEEAAKLGTQARFTKKERLMMSREIDKLQISLGGIREMYAPPALLFVIDIRREDIAVKEARRLDIPVVALVDTNCDPSGVTYPVPSNDDGTRAIKLFCEAVADAVAEGKRKQAERPTRELKYRGGEKGDAFSQTLFKEQQEGEGQGEAGPRKRSRSSKRSAEKTEQPESPVAEPAPGPAVEAQES